MDVDSLLPSFGFSGPAHVTVLFIMWNLFSYTVYILQMHVCTYIIYMCACITNKQEM